MLLVSMAILCSCHAGRNGGNAPVRQDEGVASTDTCADAVSSEAYGDDAPVAFDFCLKDIEGKQFRLSSLRGKYVVLDFWGSWCYWCMKGMPEMKKYYARYADRLAIVGINCGDTEAKWKATVAKHELPWINVYCPDGDDLLTEYDIQGFPTKIVISPDGKIINGVCGEDKSFYQCLDELLSEE